MVQALIRWFYCLDLSDVTAAVLVGILLFWWVESVAADRRWWRWGQGVLLLSWAAVLLFMTVWSREGVVGSINLSLFHSYRVALAGDREMYRSIFMNVVLFVPAGLFGASLCRRLRHASLRVLLVTIALLALSIGVEWAQYAFALGHCEIDDVLHNTLGALLGGLAAAVSPRITPLCREVNARVREVWAEYKRG